MGHLTTDMRNVAFPLSHWIEKPDMVIDPPWEDHVTPSQPKQAHELESLDAPYPPVASL